MPLNQALTSCFRSSLRGVGLAVYVFFADRDRPSLWFSDILDGARKVSRLERHCFMFFLVLWMLSTYCACSFGHGEIVERKQAK